MRPFPLLLVLPSLAASYPATPSTAYDTIKALISRGPRDANATLQSVTSSGPGCSKDTGAFFNFYEDIEVSFGLDAMTVGNATADRTTRCLVTIDLQLNPEWKYTINKGTDIRGFSWVSGGNFTILYTVNSKTVSGKRL